jgi:hypothetical protein
VVKIVILSVAALFVIIGIIKMFPDFLGEGATVASFPRSRFLRGREENSLIR